jgi:hypothetical protein
MNRLADNPITRKLEALGDLMEGLRPGAKIAGQQDSIKKIL